MTANKLHTAAENGNIDEIAELLRYNVDDVDDAGDTAFERAVKHNQIAAARKLMELDATVKSRFMFETLAAIDPDSEMALFIYEVMRFSRDIIKVAHGEMPDCINPEGGWHTPFSASVQLGNNELTVKLINAGALVDKFNGDKCETVDSTDDVGIIRMIINRTKHYEKILNFVIEHKNTDVLIGVFNDTLIKPFKLLYIANRHSRWEFVKYILTNMNLDGEGRVYSRLGETKFETFLNKAIREDQYEIAGILYRLSGIEVDLGNPKLVDGIIEASFHDLPALKWIVEQVDETEPIYWSGILLRAIRANSINAVKYLMDRGAKTYSRMAMHAAAHGIEMYCLIGEKPSRLALTNAAANGHLDLVKHIIEQGHPASECNVLTVCMSKKPNAAVCLELMLKNGAQMCDLSLIEYFHPDVVEVLKSVN